MIRKLLSLRKPAGACGFLLALLLVFAFAGPALAVPAQPHQFYGQVTVGGAPAPQGIEVAAKIGGVQYAATVTDAQGRYGYSPLFRVPADDPDTPTKEGGRDGDTVEFYVAGTRAATYVFEIGKSTRLDLGVEAPPVTIERIALDEQSYTLTVGQSRQVIVTAHYSDGTAADVTNEASYTSSDESMATVSATGLITAVGAGETEITATYGGKTAQATVTVQAVPAGPAPIVSAINPAAVVAGKPGQTVVITGQNFRNGARVVFFQDQQQAADVPAECRSASELAFPVPTDLASGLFMMKVRNPDGQLSAEPVALTLYAGEASQVRAFPGTQGTQPGPIQAGGGVRVEVPVQVSQAYGSALVIIRVDDPDGRPVLASVEGPVPANAPVKFSAGFNLPHKTGNYTAKVFVWDGWQDMNPLVEPVQLQFSAQ